MAVRFVMRPLLIAFVTASQEARAEDLLTRAPALNNRRDNTLEATLRSQRLAHRR